MASIYSEFQIPGNDPRLVESCVVVMRKYNQYALVDGSTAVERARQVSEALINMNWNKQGIKQLVLEAKQRLLPLHELDWIKDNERACYFVWATLRNEQFLKAPTSPIQIFGSELSKLLQNEELASSYIELNLKINPSNSKERYEAITNFFDRGGEPLDWQRNLIGYLKSQWSYIFKGRKPFHWLSPDDKEQLDWAWEYIGKLRNSNENERPSLSSLQAIGYQEMYLAIYAAYDTWKVDHSTKRLFLNDFNKAWHQKKHRDNRKGKKVCNFVLKEKTKEHLDELASKSGKKLNQLIEELIEREYAINGKK